MLSHLACTLVLLISPLAAVAEFGVTYDFSGGRFGDCLLSYLHAKWISFEKKIPLIYKPFMYSSHLLIEEKELSFSQLGTEPRIRVYWGQPVHPHIHLPLLYICPYFPEDRWELEHTKRPDGSPWISFPVDWKNPAFRQIVKETVAPKGPLSLLLPPDGVLSIALHLREGGDYDFDDKYTLWPLKFPPLEFYIESLRAVVSQFPGRSLYCHVFTDALHPEFFVEKIKEKMPPTATITFGYRKKNNKPSANVLQDFFSLFHYDILIRPQSNFSLIPSLIHDFALVYSPKTFSRSGQEITITEIQREIEPELYRRLQ